MTNVTFATTINCIDGRAHLPVRQWMQAHLGIDYMDRITEPGVDKLLAQGDSGQFAAIRAKVAVSVNAHQSHFVTVVGHHDCAANPGNEAMHRQQIQQAVNVVAAWGLPVKVIGLWVDDKWQANLVCEVESVGEWLSTP